MPTAQTIVIGSGAGANFATVAAWRASLPSTNLVTQDIQPTLKLQNQKFGQIDLTGLTQDATRYVHLTADDGASIFDRADIGTLPLRYDPSKGVAVEITTNYTIALSAGNFTRISRLQIASLATGANSVQALKVTDNGVVDRCLVVGYSADSADGVNFPLQLNNATIQNSLVVQRSSDTTAYIAGLFYGSKAINCGFVSSTAKMAVGIKTLSSAAQLTNCYVMNVTAAEDGTVVATKTACYSDSGSSGYTTAAYSTANFMSVATDGTHDLRLAAGSSLINTGTTNAAGATSINGLARPVGAAYDIGPWEYNSAVADTTAPVLSSPTGTATSATSASGTVATDEAGGTLYFMASTNATESAATVKAGSSATVTATGQQSVVVTGLLANTTYYMHYLQRDAAGNDSTVANSSSFLTPAVDSVAPTFAGGAAITPGTITQSSVAFSYPVASDNVAVTGYQTSRNGGASWQDNGTGLTGQFTGLAAGTTYQIAVRAYDAAGNKSAPLTLSMTTVAAPSSGTFKTRKLANNTGTAWAAGTAVAWEWHQARIGTQGAITYGGGTIDTDQTLTASGIPVGTGFLLMAVPGASLTADRPYYEAGTVA